MLEQSQSLIFLLKAYSQFLQGSEPSFQEIHSFHKNWSYTCKKNFYKSILDFQNHFQIFQFFYQCFNSVFQPIIYTFQSVVQESQSISFLMCFFKSFKKLTSSFIMDLKHQSSHALHNLPKKLSSWVSWRRPKDP